MSDKHAELWWFSLMLGALIALWSCLAFGAGGEPLTAALPLPPAGALPRAARAPIIVEAILGGTVLALPVVLIGAMLKRMGDE